MISNTDLQQTVLGILERLAEDFEPDDIIAVLDGAAKSLPNGEARVVMMRVVSEFIHRDASLTLAQQEMSPPVIGLRRPFSIRRFAFGTAESGSTAQRPRPFTKGGKR